MAARPEQRDGRGQTPAAHPPTVEPEGSPIPLPERLALQDLELRCWRVSDVDALADAIATSSEHLRPWMPWMAQEPLARTDRLRMIESWEVERLAGGEVVYGMWIDGEVVGGTGLKARIGAGGLEIGYWVHVDHLGRGLAGRASRALTEFAFSQEGIDRVEIHHDVANRRSGRVPEKLGFSDEGIREGPCPAPASSGRSRIWRMSRARWDALAANH